MKERYVIADLDPFGSPSQYVDSLLRAVTDGGLISVTATDTGVLYGKYPKVCFRKYYSKPINCAYSNETAVRILISFLGLVAGKMDLSIEPIFAHSHRHYSRVYAKVRVSSNEANKLADNLGYISHCFNCGNRIDLPLTSRLPSSCRICENNNSESSNKNQKNLHTAGPLWIKPIFNKRLISDVLRFYGNNSDKGFHDLTQNDVITSSMYFNSDTTTNDHRLNTSYSEEMAIPLQTLYSDNSVQVPFQKYYRQIFQMLHIASLELDDQPYYYTIDEIGSAMKTSPLSMSVILERIAHGGFRASRTSFRPTGLRTNASMEEIKKLL